MNTGPSSASNTDLDESFEDATDAKFDSIPSSPIESSEESHPKMNETQGADTTKEGKDTSTDASADTGASDMTEDSRPTTNAASDNVSTKSVKSMADSINQNDSTTSTISPNPPPRTSRFQGFSAALPSVPWGPPPPHRKGSDARSPSPQPPANSTGRKVNTPFAWFSRASSGPKETKSPPLITRPFNPSRRNTAASGSTPESNSDLMLKAFEDGNDGTNGQKSSAKISLRDKFKMLRMREEAGITLEDHPEGDENSTNTGFVRRPSSSGNATTRSGSVHQHENGMTSPILSPSSPRRESNSTINPNLASGTVSGMSTAASDAYAPIDWDFWQTVVNEGPQAVARTSPEELTAAISGGIPQTIRGVIWQVLAGSKNADLEMVYHELKSKETSIDLKELSPAQSAAPESQMSGTSKEKESLASSRSSVRSDHSTPATSANVAVESPSPSRESTDPLSSAKLQIQLASERAKKAKADSVAMNKLEKMIRRDMGSRTSYSKYTAAAGYQEGLFNVCRAYALFDDAVGYPQGMNFIIMPMLFVMSEEEAFCLLSRLMNKYHVRELFINDMPGLHLHLYQFERLLEDIEPALFCHLNRRGVTPKLYATPWFLTLFAYKFPLQLVMRVYDLVLCEGLEGAILKFGMAIIQRNVETLLNMNDMQTLTTFLKEKLFDVYIDAAPSSKSILESGFFGNSGGSDTEVYRADLLVKDACSVPLTQVMLHKYREEWEEKTKIEKTRETELENLRTDTISKASQIRALEQRAEKSDTEHVEIANELVKLKVENSELQDTNESLRGQVEELRKVAESEARNVEERLKAGTDQVMQRNIEVQNENRHIEEQMADMERELVEIKMKYAELNADHEGLKQRWNDLRKALD